jgi:hypothetical protein
VLVGLAVVAAAGLAIWLLARRRAQQRAWLRQTDRLVRDTDALADLAAAGPAGPDPQQQVAHWSSVEQRTTELAAAVDAAGAAAPNDQARQALAGLSAAVADYLGTVNTTRQLHIGPPAPTDEQLQFAEADSAQRLAQLQRAVAPLRPAVASPS